MRGMNSGLTPGFGVLRYGLRTSRIGFTVHTFNRNIWRLFNLTVYKRKFPRDKTTLKNFNFLDRKFQKP
jgi:hypothetical protein